MKKFTYGDLLAYLGISSAHPGGFELTKQLLNIESIKPNMNVLEIGCGTGKTAGYLSKYNECNVTAIDNNPLMIEKARQRAEREGTKVDFLTADAERLPFSDSTFDLILIESVTVFTDMSKSIQEYFRVLKDGGIFIDMEMTAETELDYIETSEYQLNYGITKVPTENGWISKYVTSNFSDVNVIYKGKMTSPYNQQQGWEMPEMLPTGPMTPFMYDILVKHQEMTIKYFYLVGFRVFRGLKRVKG